jgi:putative flippase GtrA
MPRSLPPAAKRALGFGLVGVIGFGVDALVLSLALPVLGAYGGRALSFACAVTATYVLNRRFVFAAGAAPGGWVAGWVRFVLANAVGAIANLSVYGALVASGWAYVSIPQIALAIGSIVGFGFNFVLSDRLVFNRRP